MNHSKRDQNGCRRPRRRRTFSFGACCLSALLLIASSGGSAFAQEEYEGWNLEPGIGRAHLVMVVRVTNIGQLVVVEGAKTDVTLREFRFQPVRKLKGLFQRDQLSMTASDLGLSAHDTAAVPLKEGEFRLLILAQQEGRIFGCVAAAPGAMTFEERVPRVDGPDDPLVGVVETLIQVADSRSRRERAALLLSRLESVEGRSAAPLLSSLRMRADWAAAEGRALPSLTRLVRGGDVAARNAAIEVLRDVLASRVAPSAPRQLESVAEALRSVLDDDKSSTRLRVAALDGLGDVLALKAEIPWAQDLLIAQLNGAETNAERTAAVRALAFLDKPAAVAAVKDALAKLPLDEPAARESIYARAAAKLSLSSAEEALLSRLERSMAARQSLDAEIEALGRMRSTKLLPLILAAAGQASTSPADRQRIAWAFGRLGDDRAVPTLIGWMRGESYQLREAALTALESIDSRLAAQEARPLLKSEGHLPYKLRLARLLARHQLGDGYALATEHLADAQQTASATLVLAALNDVRTSKDLAAIIAARPDRRWHAAALTGLVATGDADAKKQLLAILGDERHPLAADAAEAAGLAGDPDLLRPLAALVRSRNKNIALAALMAVQRYASNVRSAPRGLAAQAADDDVPLAAVDMPQDIRASIASASAALVLDAYVDADVRQAAFEVARRLRGENYAKLLADLADQAELERSQLLAMVESEMRRQRGVEN